MRFHRFRSTTPAWRFSIRRGTSLRVAIRQIEALGFHAADVRHIVLTHLDFDHAGGIEDFFGATVHVLRPEMRAARRRRSVVARNRYRPMLWDEKLRFRIYDTDGAERALKTGVFEREAQA